ncbi:hypothetical protein SAMN06295974_3804 [Plantibacter flavus]|uniref:Uncharacterized protein n=1 Tax=Plantibacter flavus TaxID=150123 RepID=A0A3N2BLB0_9MICO|nr:hypothetical protein [Plantibacter flavus]ROR76049.1 hypothetical protein EDD42_4002 [Plantibacter flavus]SMG48997.1 hypothetical protein SAMN06295974_3804 [Plantibacter flavus]
MTSQPIDEIAHRRHAAEEAFRTAKAHADELRIEHTRLVLGAAFPRHTVAIFARQWDEDQACLVQLLTDQPGVTDIDLMNDPTDGILLSEQRRAIALADQAVILVGSDEDLWRLIGTPEVDHSDWSEFPLELRHVAHQAAA